MRCLIVIILCIGTMWCQTNEFIIKQPTHTQRKGVSTLKQEIAERAGHIVQTCNTHAQTITKKESTTNYLSSLHQCMRVQKYALEIVQQILEDTGAGPLAHLTRSQYAHMLEKLQAIDQELNKYATDTHKKDDTPCWRTYAQRIKHVTHHPQQ